MVGFKRVATSKSKSTTSKKEKQSVRVNRNQGEAASSASNTGRRGRKRKSAEDGNVEEEEEVYTTRKHVFYEDEDDDIQAEYREDGGTMIGDIWIPPRFTRQEQETQGVRLIIEKIVCENFKSYGGVKEMGPYHKNFTSIVGPNGNGKSNIIDAMLFVFGYRNTKLRCKKASLLIHNSELLPNLQTCAVTVHFVKVLDEGSDDENTIVIPDSRITVTRRVDLQNKSIYSLDGREVKFHDVAAFIKANGVDIVNNRFLILQGEVESIAQMPPKQKNRYETGVLEYLEDIIGTKRYAKALSQLEDKVDKLNFEREAKLHSVDIVENEKRDLKEPVEKAKDFLRAKNSLSRNKHKLYQFKIFSTRAELAEVEADKKECEDRVCETKKKLEKIEGKNSDYEKEYQERVNVTKGFEEEKLRLKKKLETAESQFTKLKEQLTRANNQRKKAIKDITIGEKEFEELEQIPVTASKNLKDLQKRREDMDVMIANEEKIVEKELKQLDGKVEKLSKENEGLVKNFMNLKKVRDEKKQKSEVLVSELKVLNEQEKNEGQKYETIVKELEELKKNMEIKSREARSSLGSKVGGLEQGIRQRTQELEGLRHEEKLAKTEAENTRVAYDNARETFENSHTNDNIYKAFFAEQDKGRFKGLYGRLRDLATIDEKYNVAATVASGLWDHWVVDTDSTGEEAIKFLRQQNLPFQNFQCLNKLQRYLQLSRKAFKAPQNSQRLYDLIKISKPEVAAVFYKALNDTLVTQNIDIGSQIAYSPTNRNRVTTLAGEVIDPSGQMTGGGRQKIIGKMNGRMAARLERSISEQDYKKLKFDMDQALKHYNEISNQRQSLDDEVRNLTLKLRDIQVKLDSSKSDLESMKNQLKLKEKRVLDQEQKVKEATVSPKLLQEKESQVKKAQEIFEDANKPCAKAETEVKKIEQKLKSLQCDKRKEIRNKLDFQLEQRGKVISDFNKHSVALKNHSKNLEKLKTKLDNLRSDKTNLESEMLKMEENKKELTEKAVKLTGTMNENTESLEKAKMDLHELKSSMSEFHKKRAVLDKERVIQETELSNSIGRYKAIAGNVNSVKDKMKNMELSKIPEEEVDPFEVLTEEQLDDVDTKEMMESIAAETQRLKNEKPNLGVLEQYKLKLDEFLHKVQELDAVTITRDKFRTAYITTTGQRLSEFMEGFAVISSKLKEMFRMISMGGDAELELVDSTDPFSCGISMCVRPANKAWKKISNLSGGEKTLASLALIFALHHYKPSPFYVMDEIDAALDFKNVSIIANYIKDRTKFTQFIIISLRSHMFELADSMLGVYKVDNMSYSIHMHIGNLLSKLRTKFVEAGRTFPLETDYQANNRSERRKEMEKVIEEKKKKAEKQTLFSAEFSLIREDDDEEDLELDQPPKESQTQQGQTDPQNSDAANMETQKLGDAETQKIDDAETQKINDAEMQEVNDAETQKITETQREDDVETSVQNEENVEESIQSVDESEQSVQLDESMDKDVESSFEIESSVEKNGDRQEDSSYEERIIQTPCLNSSSEAEG